ncbi:hypothetical protein [Photobacterium phosphoreum]|uniref:hypothetical protein n=1 Tax=Photobacterium phosphoreum TaxID=659 RepID=UPI0024B7C59E|nr:hypothetical protein [Photobacterium phosphoreum]
MVRINLKIGLVLLSVFLTGCFGSDSDSDSKDYIKEEITFTSAESFLDFISETNEITSNQTVTLQLKADETFTLKDIDLIVKGNLIIK